MVQTYQEGQDILDQRFAEDPIGTTTNGLLMANAMSITIPTSDHSEWIGSSEEKTYILETIPWFDSIDFFVLLLWTYIGLLVAKHAWNNLTTGSALIVIILWFTLGYVFVWVLWKALMYWFMLNRGEALGLNTEQVLNIRTALNSGEESVTRQALIGGSIVGMIGVLGAWFGRK